MSSYDVPMIRDFLAHLLLEIRISLHETQGPVPPVKDALAKQLRGYLEKYGTSLLPVTAVKAEPGMDAVVEASRARDRRELEGLVESLERLRPLFDLALNCVASPEQLVVRKVPLSVLADENVSWASR